MPEITRITLRETPAPVLLIEGETDFVANIKFRCDCDWLINFIDPDCKLGLLRSEFRGVSIDRLPQVLSAGIDVEPTDAHFFADRLDKAVEYGGVPKVVIALDPTKLDRTFREVPANANPKEIAELRKKFPTEFRSKCGNLLWLTKFALEDRRATTAYERNYAHWIPGNPMEALRAVLIFSDSKSFQAVLEALDQAHIWDSDLIDDSSWSVATAQVQGMHR